VLLRNSFFEIVVPNKPQIRFDCQRYLDSWSLVLECKWKAADSPNLLSLFIWDAAGQSLRFQFEMRRQNLQETREYDIDLPSGGKRKLENAHLYTEGSLPRWDGQVCETTHKESASTQVEMIAESGHQALAAYLHFQAPFGTDDTLAILRQALGSLVIQHPNEWEVTKKIERCDR